jgi:phosphoglycerol transferase MdoB-like AlkP superfamily enzyme
MPDMQRGFAAYGRRFLPLAVVFLAAQFAVRLTLALRAGGSFIDGPLDIARPFVIGLWFDVLVLLVALLPGTVYWMLMPKNWRGARADTAVAYVGFAFALFLIGFTMIGEHLFWTEFNARFNFIAVDYLVYTREVIGNIWESYPVGKLLAVLVTLSVAITYLLRNKVRPEADRLGWMSRAVVGLSVFALAGGVAAISKSAWTQASTNIYANELSANGYYAILQAYFHNEIDYRRFYVTANEHAVADNMRTLIGQGRGKFVSADAADITHDVVYPEPANFKNVILVTMESLSASYMGQFGNGRGLTPNLDRLADQGIFFTNLLATGTRTVRGLEAVTLSVPPTPGQSILRRPGHDNMFSIGSVFRDHGYDVRYMYGGDGEFDNMNAFFRANGYRVIDRAQLQPSEITFANAWGVCDEDVFARAIKESDRSHAAGVRFFTHIMTVSNHRPYTYPPGRISPPALGPQATLAAGHTLGNYIEQTREGGVKYTDYAIGKFIEAAKTRPWFDDTLFVFVADHTASAAGKVEVDPNGYHIPAIFYAPGFIQPRRIGTLASQMDIAPSILGLLQISHRSRFVGVDQINGAPVERALISNYEKVALVRDGKVMLLGPRRDVREYDDGKLAAADRRDRKLLFDTVTYYQYASGWRERFKYVESAIPHPRNE